MGKLNGNIIYSIPLLEAGYQENYERYYTLAEPTQK
jgi:hypothetical protein